LFITGVVVWLAMKFFNWVVQLRIKNDTISVDSNKLPKPKVVGQGGEEKAGEEPRPANVDAQNGPRNRKQKQRDVEEGPAMDA
jgi:hypothetical protein